MNYDTTEPSDKAITRLTDAIEAQVKARVDHVSSAELALSVPGFLTAEAKEQYAIRLADTLVWAGVTKTAAQALWNLLDERRVCLQNTTLLVYACDGMMLHDKNRTPMVLRPARFANIVTISGVPLCAAPRELKAAKRRIAKDKKLGPPSPVVLEAALARSAN